jgi:hypothetical protein
MLLAAAHRRPAAECGHPGTARGNRRLQRFVVIQRSDTVRLVRMVVPGMFQHPTAIVVICIDWRRVAQYGMPRQNAGVYVDVGTALQTMLLAAHALGLGAGAVTSFSKAAVGVILNLPAQLSPEVLVCLGIEQNDVYREVVASFANDPNVL